MQALKEENEKLEKLVRYECIKNWKSQHALYKTIDTLYVRSFQEGLGHDSFDGQASTHMVLGGQEVITFASENGPQSLVEKASVEKGKTVQKVINHEDKRSWRQVTSHAPQVSFDASYVLKRDHCGNVVAKYVGSSKDKKNARGIVWVHKILVTNMPNVAVTNKKGPKHSWVPKTKA